MFVKETTSSLRGTTSKTVNRLSNENNKSLLISQMKTVTNTKVADIKVLLSRT